MIARRYAIDIRSKAIAYHRDSSYTTDKKKTPLNPYKRAGELVEKPGSMSREYSEMV